MNIDNPPPYGPSAPGFPQGYNPQPGAYPGYPTQGYPTTGYPPLPAGYQGPPAPYLSQPGYHQGYQAGPMVCPAAYAVPPKNTVYMMDKPQEHHGGMGGMGGSMGTALAACCAALSCCCLWDMCH